MQTRRHRLYGKFISLFRLKKIWQDIVINFVIRLSLSFHKKIAYNFILIVINRYSKMVQYIPYNKNIDAEKLAKIMKNRIF
jgi:hypothetical protein